MELNPSKYWFSSTGSHLFADFLCHIHARSVKMAHHRDQGSLQLKLRWEQNRFGIVHAKNNFENV
jgi:hypothetical protein